MLNRAAEPGRIVVDTGGGGTPENYKSDEITSGSVLTLEMTLDTGTDTILVVFVNQATTGTRRTVSSITWNGDNLTRVAGASQTNDDGTNFAMTDTWYIVNPDSGTHDIVVTFNDDINSGSASATAHWYEDVDQTSPIAVSSSTTSNTSTCTQFHGVGTAGNITPFAFCNTNEATAVTTNNGTERTDDGFTAHRSVTGDLVASGTGSFPQGVSTGTPVWTAGMVELEAA